MWNVKNSKAHIEAKKNISETIYLKMIDLFKNTKIFPMVLIIIKNFITFLIKQKIKKIGVFVYGIELERKLIN